MKKCVLVVLVLLAAACGSKRPPVVTPPAPPVCDGRDVVIYTLDQNSRPLPGVRVSSTAQDADRISDGSGFSHRWACSPADYAFILEGWHTINCGAPGAACNLAGPEHRVHLARDAIPEPPAGVNADPVKGAIWCKNGVCGDDTGVRPFVIIHAGDLPLRWHAAHSLPEPDRSRYIAEILGDLDDFAREGYTIVRSWSHIRPGNGVWSRGGSPRYNGLDALNKSDFVAVEASLAREVAKRGMRLTLETGGIDGLNTAQEQTVMRRFNEVLRQVGSWMFAWVSPVNEPSSVHGTSDDNGDVEPGHLRMLVDIARAGTSVLWHLGHAGGDLHWDDGTRFAQKRYTPADQAFGYYHGYRWGAVTDKIRHRFSVLYEAPGKWKRFWIDGEGVGAPVCDGSLRCVSNTRNGQEMNSPEALALIVAMQSVRGIGSEMSGDGVQRYQSFKNVVGFRNVPWAVRQLHRDVATFQTIHHSGDTFRSVRVIEAQGEIRIDGVIANDGRFDYIIHGPRAGSYNLRVARSFSGKLCDPGAMQCTDVSVNAGGTLPVSFTYGRILVGHTR